MGKYTIEEIGEMGAQDTVYKAIRLYGDSEIKSAICKECKEFMEIYNMARRYGGVASKDKEGDALGAGDILLYALVAEAVSIILSSKIDKVKED